MYVTNDVSFDRIKYKYIFFMIQTILLTIIFRFQSLMSVIHDSKEIVQLTDIFLTF